MDQASLRQRRLMRKERFAGTYNEDAPPRARCTSGGVVFVKVASLQMPRSAPYSKDPTILSVLGAF